MELLYAKLIERLAAKAPSLQYIDLDTGQIDNEELNYPIPLPAALISFDSIGWDTMGELVQAGTVNITVRVAFPIYEDTNQLTPAQSRLEGLNKLLILKEVHAALHGFGFTHFNTLSRYSTTTERRPDNLTVFSMVYKTYLIDTSARPHTTPTDLAAQIIMAIP
jgi:hypothetical protein